MKIHPSALSKDSVVLFSPHPIRMAEGQTDVFWPTPCSELDDTHRPGYVEESFVSRLGISTKLAIVRPDFYVFACAKDVDELVGIPASLKVRLV